MKKFKFSISFLLLVFICVVANKLLLLINYILALTLHELAHVYIATKKGYSLKEFKLSLFGVSIQLNEQIDDNDSFAINIAGPVFNLLLCLICVAMYWLIPVSYKFLNLFCVSNLTLAVFNLLPIYPLDGGKIFASITEKFKYRKLEKLIRYGLSAVTLICFVTSCFYSVNWFFLVLFVFLITSKGRENNKMSLFKFSKSKNFNKVELLKTSGDESLFELLKKIQSKKYTIFYFNLNKPTYIDEDEVIELSTKYPLSTKLKEACKF